MAFVVRKFSNTQINRAGTILAKPESFGSRDQDWAASVLANWRACHGYPINTFQATLRSKLKSEFDSSIVAQRLKRAPSIISKLQRFQGMQLARMQDIGGLRAVLRAVAQVRHLEKSYRVSSFAHTLTNSKNYIDEPKDDGYRGVHLIYRYKSNAAPAYDGLSLELQLRTSRQHAWATAVETMGTFLGQALKSGQGDDAWRAFFREASAALTHIEKTPPIPGFENMDKAKVFAALVATERRLNVLEKLQGFAIAAEQITTERGQGAYHLIVLDSVNRRVAIRPYPVANLEQANVDYAEVEQRTRAGEGVDAVLVAAGPITALRKAYPNYFLDTQAFLKQMNVIIEQVTGQRENKRLQRASRLRRR